MLVPITIPFTSTVLEETIAKITKAHPLIGVRKIGASRLGRIIYALTIGSGARTILINAAHHANEWITSVVAMKFLEDCASEPDKSWMDDTTLHIIPMVNPDGVDLVTGGISTQSFAYRHAQSIAAKFNDPFPNGWKANILGVDLNSNYPAGWELAGRHKYARGYTIPAPRDYVGVSPLSEPETTALAAYTKANDFALTLSLHTQGEEIFWQYPPHNPKGAEELALRLSAVSGYKLEEVPSESSHAGYRDWFIQEFNRPGYTIECGLGENPLPIADFDNIYKKTAPLLWEAVN